MIIAIGLIYFAIKALSEWNTDFDLRQDAINKGYDSYSSSTGLRDIKTEKHVYYDASTGKKTMW